MCQQGRQKTIIEDDIRNGRDVLMTPGRHISRGSIIAGGCVLCKDFSEYSIVGGTHQDSLNQEKINENITYTSIFSWGWHRSYDLWTC